MRACDWAYRFKRDSAKQRRGAQASREEAATLAESKDGQSGARERVTTQDVYEAHAQRGPMKEAEIVPETQDESEMRDSYEKRKKNPRREIRIRANT